MDKDFDTWNTLKKAPNQSKSTVRLNFHEREIWWCSFGVNVGNEQDGVGTRFERPCLILRKLSPTTSIVVPLSTKKKLSVFQVLVVFKNNKNYALLDQLRVIDVCRLRRKIGYVPNSTFDIVKQQIITLIKR